MKWFKNVQAAEELRKQYRILLKKYHPDNPGGSVGATQEINREYDELFDILSRQKNADAPKKTYSAEENEQLKLSFIKCLMLSGITLCSKSPGILNLFN